MAKFRSTLITQIQSDNKSLLKTPLIYESDILGIITVPAGFKTDFASVPRIPLAYMLFGGVAKQAAVVHDYLYSRKDINRKDADNTFLEAMKVSGVSFFKRQAMYAAVRLFGWSVRK